MPERRRDRPRAGGDAQVSVHSRWTGWSARRRQGATARRVVAAAEAHVFAEAELLDYADWLHERWPDARLVVSRPARGGARVEIAYAGDVPHVPLHAVDVERLHRLAGALLATGESRVVHPVVVGTGRASGEAAHS
jgi:hypothetical protein